MTNSSASPSKQVLVYTGAIEGTSGHRLYQEIGLESLADRRWFLKIFFFHKFVDGLLPSYLQSYLNNCNNGEYQAKSACQTRLRLFLEEPTLLIRLFIHALLKNNVYLVKKFET